MHDAYDYLKVILEIITALAALVAAFQAKRAHARSRSTEKKVDALAKTEEGKTDV